MKKNKTWVRPKEQSLICGYCETCNKQLMSDEGGSADKKGDYF